MRRRCVAQDYVRGIAELIAERGEARVTDLSSRLGVAPATVSVQVRRLVDVGLARSERYRSIQLTPAGWRLAAACLARRAIVRDLLVALGVDRETAETDAEGMAHHASESTLAAIRNALASYDARQPTPTRRKIRLTEPRRETVMGTDPKVPG